VALNGVGIYGSSDGTTQECVTSLGNTASGMITVTMLIEV
jgi:hypothetical protein